MPSKNSSRILWISLLLGLCFNLLFWGKVRGLPFFLFVFLVTAAGFIIARLDDQKPAGLSWILAGFAVFFAAMTFIRQEPFTTFSNGLVSMLCLILLALTFSSGIWLRYSLADVMIGFFRLIGSALAGGSTLLAISRKSEIAAENDSTLQKHRGISIWAVLRGLLLAFPVVFILALLLVSADPVFSKELEKFLDITRFAEYAVRLVIIGIVGYVLSGIYLYSMEKSKRIDLIGLEKPWFPTLLGFTESSIILIGVDLLFAFFVAIQFKYFFGGQANIVVDGYTYAEYARRGFGELVWVAIFSLMLFLGLSAITRRESVIKQHWFSGLSLLLVGLVMVILVSSYMRLSLLEAAYGFTRLRAYSHIFMVWLGILLATVFVLEVIHYRRGFAMAAFIVFIGFVFTLNILNVDGLIVQANVNRAETRQDNDLDYLYLQDLSTDAIPQALAQFRSTPDSETKHQLGASLACRASTLEQMLKSWDWKDYHVSFNTAVFDLRAAKDELRDYKVIFDEEETWRNYKVKTPLGEKDCYKTYFEMD
jgi:hypothetical protein